MASKKNRFANCEHLFSTCNNENSGSRNESVEDYSTITERLQNLPTIKASEQFDQKMAAAFAMELQKEALQINRSWLEKHAQISLPDVVSDLTKNLL